MAAPRSITLRLTVLFAVMSSAVLLMLGFFIGDSVDRHFEEQDLDILTARLESIRSEIAKAGSSSDLAKRLHHLDGGLGGHDGAALAVASPSGELLHATPGSDFPPSLLKHRGEGASVPVVWRTASGTALRGIAATVKRADGDAEPMVVALAVDIAHHEQFMAAFRSTLWSFVVLATLLTGFLGWIAVRRGLAPLQDIRQRAESITATRLDARLSVDSVPIELAELTHTLNSMLSRLERSFRRLSDFSSDLAHEFRTPISNLLTQSQVTLSKARSEDEYREVLASNIEEYERLSRMIADMLFLAKADEGQIVPSKDAIALGRTVAELVEFYRPLAEDKNIDLRYSGEARIHGDRLMIRRAISNLLSNALRHTPRSGRVEIAVESEADAAVLSVTNTGETIPAEHLPRLFDRFYRADASRHRQTEGAGLGLAITRSILQAHGGSVAVRSEDGVTTFILRIPPAD